MIFSYREYYPCKVHEENNYTLLNNIAEKWLGISLSLVTTTCNSLVFVLLQLHI